MTLIILASLLAFYLAWNLGANDVANSMATSVGSKTLTMRQALGIAGVLEFLGAVLLGQSVSGQLATGIVNPALFAETPERFLVGMVAVLISCCLWLNAATLMGWPVSSSHAVVGAIAGLGMVSVGWQQIHWQTLGVISLTWVLTPLVSGGLAAGVYALIRWAILRQEDPQMAFQEWLPWLSVATLGVFGSLIYAGLQPTLQKGLDGWGWTVPPHTIGLGFAAIAITYLTASGLKRFTPHTSESLEPSWSRFQVVSASFVAFAHGSNDVGNAIAPLAVITYISAHHQIPLHGFAIPLWLLVLGGSGIVLGLAMMGQRVIHTVGEDLTTLQPSSGYIAEFVTAITVLVASHLGLPVSTSHAIVGGVVGIGLVCDRNALKVTLLKTLFAAWVVTIPLCGLMGAGLYWVLLHLGFPNVAGYTD